MASIARMLIVPSRGFRAVQRPQRNALLVITEFYWTGEGIKPE
jgi:hypothetical protein